MYVVALASVAGSQETAAQPIAELVGRTAYEVRMWLKQVLPRVVLQTTEPDEAQALAAALREADHRVVVLDTERVVPLAQMVRVKRIVFDSRALQANSGTDEALAYDAIETILHVASRVDLTRTRTEKVGNPTLHPRTPTMKVVSTTTQETIQQDALFLFRRESERPWIVEEHAAQYLGLGPHMRPTRRENFLTTLSLLRERAWRAKFDDRFATHPITARNLIEVQGSGDPATKGTEAGVVLLANLLALSLTGAATGPYRQRSEDL
jgi:hypothetical protein